MYESELSTCDLGAVVCVLLAAGIGLGWHYLDNAVAGPLLPQLRSHSTMRPVLRDRPLLLGVKAQSSMCHSFLAHPATPTRPASTRDALRVMPAENTNLTVQLPGPRRLDGAR